MDYQRIDWMSVGKEHWEGNQDKIEKYCNEAEVQTIPCSMAFCPGEAIKSMIAEFHISKVDRVASSHEMAPYGLVGVNGHYKDADVWFFAVDEGSHLVSLCAFVNPK